jgi:DNA-binding NtrC family response regulator
MRQSCYVEETPKVVLPVGLSLKQAERLMTFATFEYFDRDTEKTSKALGISQATLYDFLKDYSVENTG